MTIPLVLNQYEPCKIPMTLQFPGDPQQPATRSDRPKGKTTFVEGQSGNVAIK